MSTLALVAVLLTFVIAGMILTASIDDARVRRFHLEATSAAVQLNGRFESGNWMAIRFHIGNRAARLEVEPEVLRVVVDVRGRSPGALQLHRHGVWARRWPGGYEVSTGDVDLDNNFAVRANPRSLVGEAAWPEVAQVVRRLRALGVPAVDLLRETFSVRVAPGLRDAGSLVALARLAEDLHDLVIGDGSADAGILWVSARLAAGGQCQVCGAEMTSDVVKCASCATPHHRDCWRYVGGCSTFACQSRRFV